MPLRIGPSSSSLVNNTSQTRLNDLNRQLSSGRSINSAADNPAGLVISNQLRSQIGGLDQASENGTQAVSIARTAEGALSGASDILNRARELVLANANSGTDDGSQRAARDQELVNLRNQLDAIGQETQYGSKPLLDQDRSLTFQLGPNEGQQTTLELSELSAEALNLSDLGAQGGDSNDVLARLDQAINTVAGQRGAIGAFESATVDTTLNSLATARENLVASESTIADTDFAAAISEHVNENIRSQASIMMLAQANQQRGQVLNLLPGAG